MLHLNEKVTQIHENSQKKFFLPPVRGKQFSTLNKGLKNSLRAGKQFKVTNTIFL